jgi:hypothetical protein
MIGSFDRLGYGRNRKRFRESDAAEPPHSLGAVRPLAGNVG